MTFLVASLVSLLVAAPQAERPVGSLTIRVDGREQTLTAADLAKVPRHDEKITAEGSTEAATVSGVKLWDLLQLAGTPAPQASGRQRAVMMIKLTGADGQSAAVAMVEVDPSFSTRPAIVADRRNGKALDGVEGPWRVIIPTDVRHARWIRGLVSIEVTSIR